MAGKPDDHMIVAIHVTNRVKQAGVVQAVLTEFGANIKTRIGLHEATGRAASPNGLILLEMVGTKKRCAAILDALNAVRGVEAKSVTFSH
ncbi:MAG: hypothetical protein WC708_16075 [Lentisphaeria bacterium]